MHGQWALGHPASSQQVHHCIDAPVPMHGMPQALTASRCEMLQELASGSKQEVRV